MGTRGDGAVVDEARGGRRLLVCAGALSALNGAAHLVLPVTYPPGGWAPHVEELYEPIRWALHATTVFFGVLLVLAGILTVAVARASDVPERISGWLLGGMAGFWLLAAAYEVVAPFPIREAAWALPSFSLAVAVLYLAGLRRVRQPKRSRAATPPTRRTAARTPPPRTGSSRTPTGS